MSGSGHFRDLASGRRVSPGAGVHLNRAEHAGVLWA